SMVPTAELRPTEYAQTDEEDLMPYDVLNTIEIAAIRERLSFCEIIPVLKKAYPELSDAQIDEWLRRFFRLWTTNQWKRER
ncbi:MAG: NAD+ synthetase, partial [Planctomycetia bacterium]|nr:NAD+ synthetase [Planctomycetia bacterium]